VRDLNDLPYNSWEANEAGQFTWEWCEAVDSSEDIECGDSTVRVQLAEAFEHRGTSDMFATGYAGRLRGGVERFGVMPHLDITIRATGNITKLEGGTVEVTEKFLAGAKLEVPADPRPGLPENNTWDGFMAGQVEPFRDPAQPFEAAWFDFVGYIGFQELGFEWDRLENRISHPVLIGPYRTIFNAPVTITIPYWWAANPESIKPYIYNDVTQNWDEVYVPAGGSAPVVDTEAMTVSFNADVLGIFALAEE
jgi:hypothetical protein